jgi:AraC-like DNA-binding protein
MTISVHLPRRGELPINCHTVLETRHQPVAPTQAEHHAGGDVIARHRHDDHQLIYISAGVLATHTARGAWVASSDRAVWVPAGLWHEHRLYGRSSLHTMGFPAHDAPLPVDSPAVVAVSPLLRELLIEYTQAELSPTESLRVREFITDRLRIAPVQALTIPEAQDPRLAQACRLVMSDLTEPLSLNSLAVAVSTSARTLSRLYRDEFGTTYPQWRTNIRTFQAMIDLAEGRSVTQTAHRNGWATVSSFIDAFSRVMGCTPGQYRSSVGAEADTTSRDC